MADGGVAEALALLGAAYRQDWSDFDGRSLKAQLDELVRILREGKPFALDNWAFTNGICPVSHTWIENCDDKRPDSHFSECVHVQEYYESLDKKRESA